MGDTGSMFIGGAMVGISMLLKFQLLLIPICFTCIISSVSVIIQMAYFKITHGKRIFRMTPIHHHFELGGMSENGIVLMYAGITIVLSAIAVLSIC
jgi:phospho-N-acetylmuramoyl-pentapeptide-transferase